MNPKTHFHIRWSSTPRLDWERFETREEADKLAQTLVRQNETFTIEELNGNCERCAASKINVRGSTESNCPRPRRFSGPSGSISREVARHGGRAEYRASEADLRAWQLELRPRVCRLALHEKLRTIVASKLVEDWSPQQISGWLKRENPNEEGLRVSHETIYRSLFIQARGALKQELIEHLRTKRRIRRSRHSAFTDRRLAD